MPKEIVTEYQTPDWKTPRSSITSEKKTNETYVGQKSLREELPPVIPDPEKVDVHAEDEVEVVNVNFPPPRKNKIFQRKWNELVNTIVERKNFKPYYLSHLEILCDLYVQYEDLAQFVRQNGHTYQTSTRQGMTIKVFPQVALQGRVLSEIRNYSKVLGLQLDKDKADWISPEEKSDWE